RRFPRCAIGKIDGRAPGPELFPMIGAGGTRGFEIGKFAVEGMRRKKRGEFETVGRFGRKAIAMRANLLQPSVRPSEVYEISVVIQFAMEIRAVLSELARGAMAGWAVPIGHVIFGRAVGKTENQAQPTGAKKG